MKEIEIDSPKETKQKKLLSLVSLLSCISVKFVSDITARFECRHIIKKSFRGRAPLRLLQTPCSLTIATTVAFSLGLSAVVKEVM